MATESKVVGELRASGLSSANPQNRNKEQIVALMDHLSVLPLNWHLRVQCFSNVEFTQYIFQRAFVETFG